MKRVASKHVLASLLSRTSLGSDSCFKDVAQSQYAISKRYMNLQEYQSKQLMEKNGVHIQRFRVVEDINEVKSIMSDKKLQDAKEYVIKAQVLAGGRGKGV